MRLGLSSAAAPDASLDELLAAARRRGFAALELCEGDRHGARPNDGAPGGRLAAERAAAAGVSITGYRTVRTGDNLGLVHFSEGLGAPLLIDGPGDLVDRIDRGSQLRSVGATVAVVVRGERALSEAVRVYAAGLGLAWDAEPGLGAIGQTAELLLDRFAASLHQVRLIGGGPEAVSQDDRGVGRLMRSLALAAYEGAVVLAPSTAHYRVAWENWLGRRGGWGCGSQTDSSSPVRLDGLLTTESLR